jgi:hypothetical protein
VSHKAQKDQVGSEAVVPSPRHLLQAEEGLVEPAHQLWVSGVNEVGGLALGDFVGEGVVDEDVLNIQLVNRLSREKPKVRTVRMVAGFTTRLKVSS